MNITHIDYAILGLLNQEAMSGYHVRMVFETTAMGSFSSSPGTIYPALTRLLRLQLVQKMKIQDTSRVVFAITSAGRRSLTEWIVRPVDRNDILKNMNMMPLRIAFLDLVKSNKVRLQFLDSFHQAVCDYIEELESYEKQHAASMPVGARLAFEHGLSAHRLTKQWIVKVCKTYKTR